MKRAISLVLAMLILCSCAMAEAIIGGADGPTAIFVKTEDDGPTSVYVAPEADVQVVQIIGPVTSAEVPAAMDEPIATIEPGKPTPEPTETPRLYGLKIGIDPGHQGQGNSDREPVAPGSKETKAKVSSGTSGRSTGIAEYVTVLEISLKLRDLLEQEGATVYMTRNTHDIDISNKERAEMMNELGVDLALRIHCDGAEDSSANGIALYVRKTGEKQQESEAAANVILDAMVEATGARKRGVFLRDTYTMNNWSIVPCILVECGFMSNPAEDEKLNDPAYQDLLAQGIVAGVASYFER